MEIKRDDRTQFNLENCLKMAFHPRGFKEFAEGTICELNLGQSQVAKTLRAVSYAADIAKYAPLPVIVSKMIYNYFSN